MLILASKSPRRIELLKDAGLNFKTIPSNVVEEIDYSLTKEDLTMSLAKQKANALLKDYPKATVIAADTIVYLDGKIYGKPKDEEESFQMLEKLSNRTHKVITGVAIISSDKEEIFYDVAKVTFKKLTALQITDYIKTEQPFDKAGSYAIQGNGNKIVDCYDGDFFTIMGLPLKKVLDKLGKQE